jgi:hypothetical protein
MKSSLDGIVAGDSTILGYSLWRRIDESPLNEMTPMDEYLKLVSDSLPPGEWDYILTVPAIGSETYNVVAPTLADSTPANGMHWSVFAVIAHTVDPTLLFVSEPDSGYSLDNLVPQAPTELLAAARDSVIDLSWKMVPDEDFNYYAIYRSIQGGFDPDTLQPYATTIDTFFTDMILEPNTYYYYRVSAFDFSGNEGEFSDEVSAIIVGINDHAPIPETYALFQNFPNPFNPVTTIVYQIPKTGHITIDIYNVLGQVVEIIVDTKQVPGNYAVQWNAAKFESGIYFYRLKADNFVETKKLLLLK